MKLEPADQAAVDQAARAVRELAESLSLTIWGWPKVGPMLADAVPAATLALAAGGFVAVLPISTPNGIAVSTVVLGPGPAPEAA